MRQKIAKAIQIISFSFACLFLMSGPALRADNVSNFENYLIDLAVTDDLVDPLGTLTDLIFLLGVGAIHKDDIQQFLPIWYADFDWSIENTMTNANSLITHNVLVRVEEYKSSSICQPYGCVPFKNLWVAATGSYLKQNAIQQLPGFHTTDWGFLAGFDFVVSDRLIMGAAAGYTSSDLKWDSFHGSTSISWKHSKGSDIDTFYIGPYAALNWCSWVIEASLLKGWHQFQSDRHVHLASIDRHEKNNHYGDSISLHLGGLWNYNFGFFNFEPYLSGDYVYVHVNGIKDKSKFFNDLDIHVKSHNVQFFQGEFGAILSDTYQLYRALVVPKLKVGFQNITPIVGNKLIAGLDGQPRGSFTVHTTDETLCLATAGFLLNFYVHDWPQFLVSVDGAWGNKRFNYCYAAELNWSF